MNQKPTLTPVIPSGIAGLQSRRELILTVGGAVVSLSLFGLVGCGGGGGGTNPPSGGLSLGTFSGKTVVPAGVDASKLVVSAGTKTSTLKSGAFSVVCPTDAPSLVTLLDPVGKKAVYMGMVDPTSKTPLTLDANSSAVALLFFALGGANMTRNGHAPLVTTIKNNPATAKLASVIASRLSATGFNLGSGDAQMTAAVATAAHAISPLITPKAIAKPQDAPALLLIQPTGEVNGVTLVQPDTGTGVGYQVQNAKRRSGYVYTYLTGHVDANGTSTPVNPPSQVGTALEIASTSSLLNLSTGWHPTTSATVPLTLQGTDTKSIYTMVYLTCVYGASEPAFLSDPMWAGELAKWKKSQEDLGSDTFVSYIANILFSALGFGGLTWLHSELAVAIASLTTIPSVSTLLTQAAGEDVLLGDLANFTLKEFLAGDISQALLKDVGILLRSASAEAAAILEAGALSATALAAIQVAVATFIAVGAFGLAADLGAVALDTSIGDKGDLWTGTVVKQAFTLSPQNPTAHSGDRVTFTVNPPTGIVGTIEYKWTQTSTFATLSSSDGHVGNTITTTSRVVDLVTTGSDSNPIKVTVSATVNNNGVISDLGSAQTTVTFTPVTITGGSAQWTYSGFAGVNTPLNGTFTGAQKLAAFNAPNGEFIFGPASDFAVLFSAQGATSPVGEYEIHINSSEPSFEVANFGSTSQAGVTGSMHISKGSVNSDGTTNYEFSLSATWLDIAETPVVAANGTFRI